MERIDSRYGSCSSPRLSLVRVHSLAAPRSRKGARVVWGMLALLGTLLGSWAVAGGRGPEGLGSLPWRTGGRLGFTVDAAAFPDSDGFVLEIYARIPPSTLEALARDSSGTARVQFSIVLNSGGARQEREESFNLKSSSDRDGFGRVVVYRLPARRGRQKLQVTLEDLSSRRRGLLYAGRKVTYSEKLEGVFQLPRGQMERDLSDIEFVWSEDSTVAASAFRRADRNMLPNPERLYGLFANELRAAFAARARPGDERPWSWVARILDREDHVLAERESTGAADRWMNGWVALDVSTLPAGGYDLEVKAWQDGDAGALLRRARFSVAWKQEAWLRNPGDMEDDVHLLLSAEAEDDFVQLQPGEQERFLDDFWQRRDPTPETAENESRDDFLRRVGLANELYGRPGIGKGMFSDMGRVYIRYGEPSEKLHQVIPTGDETLTQIVQQLAATETRPVGGITERKTGGDMRPFEVWIYDGDIPQPPDADPRAPQHTRHRRLVFLFVDEQGVGNFGLRYSTE